MIGPSMKRCSSCHEYKELSEFNKNKNSKDGLYHRCRSCHKKYNFIWRKKNIKRCREVSKKWKKNNRERMNKNRRKYLKNRYYNDPEFRLTVSLRNRINSAIRKKYKKGSAIKDLGCSIDCFRKYIEFLWKQGMSWDNYGNGKNMWNIDHVTPLNKFDLNKRNEFIEAVNYTNMQPMWSVENSRKNSRS